MREGEGPPYVMPLAFLSPYSVECGPVHLRVVTVTVFRLQFLLKRTP